MIEGTIFTHDAAAVVFKGDAQGVTVTDDGVQFDWSEVEKVRLDNVPIAESFNTNEFYKIPATVARPVKQTYLFGRDAMTLMKPREELKKAAWSLHNAPWTLGHPDTTMVKDVGDVHGFWRDPRYIDSMDNLDADLYVPTNDGEAKEYLEQYGDVSVGFYNRMARVDEYEGIVGGEDDVDGVDAYQTNMYFDHVASVPVGRCSSSQGCGIQDGPDSGTIVEVDGALNTPLQTTQVVGTEMDSNDASRFINPDNDRWYAVPPADNPDDEWKFPINNCSDVKDAWNLRGTGDISISVETLENRIVRRAASLGCDNPRPESDANTKMTTGNTDCPDSGQMDFGIDDLSVDAVAAKHSGVREALDAKDERIAELEKEVQAAEDAKTLADEQVEQLQTRVDAYESDEKKELVSEILEKTDSLGDEETLMALDLEDVKSKHELVMSLASTDKTAAPAEETDNKPTYDAPKRATPWD